MKVIINAQGFDLARSTLTYAAICHFACKPGQPSVTVSYSKCAPEPGGGYLRDRILSPGDSCEVRDCMIINCIYTGGA